jgi:hypothetical protein
MLNDAGKEWSYEGGSNRDVKPGSLGSIIRAVFRESTYRIGEVQ